MPFGSLWLPVVVAAVAVWIVSAILHMALKYHMADYKKLPDEETVAGALRKESLAPGYYFLPYAMGSSMKDPAVIKRFQDGPVAFLTVLRNGPPAFGKSLVQWLLLCFLVSFVIAYVARHTLTPATDGMTVLRVTGTIAFLGYGFGYFQDSIWRGMPWSNTWRGIADALVYAIVTGLIFRWLWPGG
jgi:hypothetical protein